MGMDWTSLLLLFSVSWSFFISSTHQLQSSQTQVLLQLKKHLEYPKQLEIWYNSSIDFCYLSSSQVNITCQENFVSELRIMGDNPRKVSNFYGFSVPDQTLSGNFSMDSFVATLSRLSSLKTLTLVSLGIWGSLPDKIHRLYSLQYLDLSWNFLSGSIPPTLSRLVNLQTLTLDGNFFNGTIPDSFDSLSNLKVLSLRDNRLTGSLPFSIFSFPHIGYLNFASNMLNGSLPIHLNCGNELGFVDISNNRLRGQLPSCLSRKLDRRVVKYGGNCLSIDSSQQHPESNCARVQTKKKESRRVNVAIPVSLIVGIFVLVVFLVLGFLVLCRMYRSRGISEQHLLHKSVQENSVTGFPSELLTNARFISEAKLVKQAISVNQLFSLEELKEATNNFDKSCLMGEGSTGKLYKGRLGNGTQVAIRCLTVSKRYTNRNLKLRLDLLAKLRHPHLVCFLGHCIDDEVANKVYLIHEYVSNGNYRTHLSENSPEKVLKWSERLTVLVGVAKAVHFLHTGIIPGFFSNRLKSNNILLNEHRMAKLSDYGLSIVAQDLDNHDAKEEGLKSWQMKSLEDDVYCFGFILLESIVGPSVSARREAFLLNEMASLGSEDSRRRIVDPTVLASCSQESLSIVISITTKCISPDSSTHPSFEDVLWNLQYAAQVQATTDGDQRF